MGWKSAMRRHKAKAKSSSKRKEDAKTIPQTREDVLVNDVRIIGKRREPDPEKVKSLAASISMMGLRTPITVRRIEKERDGVSTPVLALVAGGYRLQACKSLGHKRIAAFVIDGDKTDARMLHLIENLYRADLTALQHAEDLAELIELVLADKAGQVAHPGGKQPHDRGISRAAKTLGFSREEVRRSIKIANVTVEAKAKAVEVGFDKNQSRLLEIADADGAEAQLAKIDEQLANIDEMTKAKTSRLKTAPWSKAKAKKKTSDDAVDDSDEDNGTLSLVPEPEDQSDSGQQDSDNLPEVDDNDDKEKLFSALKAAWDVAPRSVRKRFVKKVLHLDLDQIDDEVWAA